MAAIVGQHAHAPPQKPPGHQSFHDPVGVVLLLGGQAHGGAPGEGDGVESAVQLGAQPFAHQLQVRDPGRGPAFRSGRRHDGDHGKSEVEGTIAPGRPEPAGPGEGTGAGGRQFQLHRPLLSRAKLSGAGQPHLHGVLLELDLEPAGGLPGRRGPRESGRDAGAELLVGDRLPARVRPQQGQPHRFPANRLACRHPRLEAGHRPDAQRRHGHGGGPKLPARGLHHQGEPAGRVRLQADRPADLGRLPREDGRLRVRLVGGDPGRPLHPDLMDGAIVVVGHGEDQLHRLARIGLPRHQGGAQAQGRLHGQQRPGSMRLPPGGVYIAEEGHVHREGPARGGAKDHRERIQGALPLRGSPCSRDRRGPPPLRRRPGRWRRSRPPRRRGRRPPLRGRPPRPRGRDRGPARPSARSRGRRPAP